MFGLFLKKNKDENEDVRASKREMKKAAEDDVAFEISEEVLREIAGCGDAREGISEENADQDYAAGEMNDVDGWD